MSRSVVLAVDVSADRKEVFQALTTQEGLAAFWTPDVTASPEVGAELRFGFEPAPVDLQMRVERLEPGEEVAWSCPGPWPGWEGTTVTWRLTDAPEAATRAILRHDGWEDGHDDGELGSVAYTWALVLGALDRYLTTGTPDPALR